MKKTKIICTIGPKTSSKEIVKDMILAGMDVARINLTHADYDFAEKVIGTVRELNQELKTSVAILFDTKGPELNAETYNQEAIEVCTGNQIVITCVDKLDGNRKMSIKCPDLIEDMKRDDSIMLGDGIIKLNVIDIDEDDGDIICEVMNDGTIIDRMSVNLPGITLNLDFLSAVDKNDIIFASKMDADYLALSFVRNANDVLDVNDMLIGLRNERMQIIAKVENESSLKEIDNIIKVSDGIMVARGDLGVEVELEKVPSIQKMIVNKCYLASKICIVATQMLSTMEENPRPTRAEVSDVANAVIDGVDAVMLSGETAVGRYPIETIETMKKIICNIEDNLDYVKLLNEKRNVMENDITSIIAHNVVDSANRLQAKAIVASTISGYTARMISNFRPSCPIFATTPNNITARSLALNWGVIPVLVDMFESTDQIVDNAIQVVKQMMPLENDKIIITGGFPTNNKNTNFMKIEEIKN